MAPITEQTDMLLYCLNTTRIHHNWNVLMKLFVPWYVTMLVLKDAADEFFGISGVSIHHNDMWWKKCYTWQLTDECLIIQQRQPSRKCQENPKALTPGGNNQRGVGWTLHLINDRTIDFRIHSIVHITRYCASQDSAIILRDVYFECYAPEDL